MADDPIKHSLKMKVRHDLDLEEDGGRPRRSDNIFLWTIIILVLIGVALACWIGSFYVFGHPEKPFSYALLTKLKKLDAPKRFELILAPRGDFLDAKALYERFGKLTPRELERANETLLRSYLRNYKLTQDPVPYVVGRFNILDSYELTEKNLFPSGVVALAQSTEDPNVLLEHVFTAEKDVIPSLHRTLLTGLDLPLARSSDLSAVINVKRLADGRLQITAVPLLYASYTSTTGPGVFSLEPPDHLKMEAGLPVLNAAVVREADEKYASYRRKAGLETAAKPAETYLVKVQRPVPASGGTPPPTPKPEPPVAPAVPAPSALADQPPPLEVVSPTPAEVPLQPFLSPTPTPAQIAASTEGKWPTYSPGQMPRGRLLNMPDMPDLASRGVADERIYLQGNFIVTASGPNRAVLRAQGALAESLGLGGRASKVRVIVEFPAGSNPPTENSTFSRDARRPFLITGIRKVADGQINVFAREITRP